MGKGRRAKGRRSRQRRRRSARGERPRRLTSTPTRTTRTTFAALRPPLTLVRGNDRALTGTCTYVQPQAVQDAATRRKAAQAAVEGSKVAQASTPKPADGTKKARNAGGSPSARGSRDAGGSKSTPSSTAASVSKAATAPATAGKKARGPPAEPNAGVAPVKSSSPYDAAAASAAAATDAAVLRARDAAASARAFILAQFAQLRTAIAAREAALVAAVDHVAATVERQQAEQGSHLIAHVRSLEAKEAVGEPVSVPEEMQRAQTSHAERLEIAGRSLAPQALMSGWNPQSHGTLLKAIELYGSVQMPGAPSSAYAAQPAAPAPAPAPAQRKAPPQFAPSALATSGAYGQSLGVAVAKTLDDPAILMVGGSGAAASAAAAGKFASQKVASGSDIDEAGKAAMEAAAKQLRAMKA